VEPLADRRRLQVVLLSDLRERELPVQAQGEFEKAVKASWRQPEVAVGDGEPNSLAQVRALSALHYILSRHADGTVVAATHGNLLALLMNGLDSSYGFEFWRRMTFPDVYELRFQDAVMSSVSRVWTEVAQQADKRKRN
jgi:2,3-bisphosphoglycerate-dependent phosphoglycerate mutase